MVNGVEEGSGGGGGSWSMSRKVNDKFGGSLGDVEENVVVWDV